MAGNLLNILEARLLGDTHETLSLEAFCTQLQSPVETVEALVAYGIVHPRGGPEWTFAATDLRRARIGMRLCRDLELNWAGAALALDLLEQLEELERQMACLAQLRGS
ncbi:chaperone modulator CbpM [Thermithiobacillus tepidarius DSM 3134]|uniref:chaperone modulator CbpM n=1 Tax=Thermithiobacillus tepidarius TaxID=929 RepID=UPI0004057316|nr:chaperone modulator CbpM [Thermithiobacillus tepidarius]